MGGWSVSACARTARRRASATYAAGSVHDAAGPAPSRVRVFPNPTRGAATLELDLPRPTEISVDVFDSAGRLVRRLQDGVSSSRNLTWDGRDRSGRKVTAGVYYLRVQADDHLESKRLVVIR